jgi:hypothetical protein
VTRKEIVFCLISAGAGVALVEAAFISPVQARVDWNWYDWTGMPLICLFAAGLGYLEPRHAWRWGVLPIIVVPPWILYRSGGNAALWPIFAYIFMAHAIAPVLSAYAGVALRWWRFRPPPAEPRM